MPPSAIVLLMVRWQIVRSLGLPGRSISVWVCWKFHSKEVKENSRCVEEASGRDALIFRELKSGILKLHDLRSTEVGTNLHMPDGSFLVSKKICLSTCDVIL